MINIHTVYICCLKCWISCSSTLMFSLEFCQDVCSASGLFPSLPLTALACLWSRYLNSWQSYKQLRPWSFFAWRWYPWEAHLRDLIRKWHKLLQCFTGRGFSIFFACLLWWLAFDWHVLSPRCCKLIICFYMCLHCFLSMKHLKWAKPWVTKVKISPHNSSQQIGSFWPMELWQEVATSPASRWGRSVSLRLWFITCSNLCVGDWHSQMKSCDSQNLWGKQWAASSTDRDSDVELRKMDRLCDRWSGVRKNTDTFGMDSSLDYIPTSAKWLHLRTPKGHNDMSTCNSTASGGNHFKTDAGAIIIGSYGDERRWACANCRCLVELRGSQLSPYSRWFFAKKDAGDKVLGTSGSRNVWCWPLVWKVHPSMLNRRKGPGAMPPLSIACT